MHDVCYNIVQWPNWWRSWNHLSVWILLRALLPVWTWGWRKWRRKAQRRWADQARASNTDIPSGPASDRRGRPASWIRWRRPWRQSWKSIGTSRPGSSYRRRGPTVDNNCMIWLKTSRCVNLVNHDDMLAICKSTHNCGECSGNID